MGSMRTINTVVFLTAGLLLSGCAVRLPAMPEASVHPLSSAWQVPDLDALSRDLVVGLENDDMQDYIAEVLANNPDLKSIAATVRAADYEADAVGADGKPRAALSLENSRSKDELTRKVGNSASVGLNVTWAVDLWGKLSDESKASQLLAKKARYDWHQARRVLVAQATQTWLSYRNGQQVEQLTQRLDQHNVELSSHYRETYQNGLTPYEFVLSLKKRRQISQQKLLEVQLEQTNTLRLMNTLRGQLPAEPLSVDTDGIGADLFTIDREIPATALINRPDIQAAFTSVLSVAHSTRAAHKALLPQINLTGSVFRNGRSLHQAIDGNTLWQLVGGLTQPIFNGGQLRARANQLSEETKSAWWAYKNTVLQAMREVEDLLALNRHLSVRLSNQQTLIDDLTTEFGMAQEHFGDGDLPFSDYQNMKIEYLEAKLEMKLLQQQYLNQRINLAVALALPFNVPEEGSHES